RTIRTPLPTVAGSDIFVGRDSATEREAAERDRRRRPCEIRPSGGATPRIRGRLSAATGCGEHTVRWSPAVTATGGRRDYRNRGKAQAGAGAAEVLDRRRCARPLRGGRDDR